MPLLFYYVFISVLMSSLLALLAWYKKAMTKPALAIAWFCSFTITICSGFGGFTILTLVFVFTIISDKLGRKKMERDKSEVRSSIQIIANVGTGTLVLALGTLLNLTIEAFFIYSSVMATSLADSMASGIGVLSQKNPRSILTLKFVPKGQSGGISLLGLIASLVGSLMVSCAYLAYSRQITAFLLVALCGFIGSLFDSVLGASFQGKFICSVYDDYTEKRNCHGRPSKHIGGLYWLDNNIVNLFNNLFSAILATIFLILFHPLYIL